MILEISPSAKCIIILRENDSVLLPDHLKNYQIAYLNTCILPDSHSCMENNQTNHPLS